MTTMRVEENRKLPIKNRLKHPRRRRGFFIGLVISSMLCPLWRFSKQDGYIRKDTLNDIEEILSKHSIHHDTQRIEDNPESMELVVDVIFRNKESMFPLIEELSLKGNSVSYIGSHSM